MDRPQQEKKRKGLARSRGFERKNAAPGRKKENFPRGGEKGGGEGRRRRNQRRALQCSAKRILGRGGNVVRTKTLFRAKREKGPCIHPGRSHDRSIFPTEEKRHVADLKDVRKKRKKQWPSNPKKGLRALARKG